MPFNWWTFLFESLNFVVLVYILHRLLYRPLRDAIDKRRETNARAKAEADMACQQAELMKQRLRDQITGAEQDRQELIHQALEQAKSERKKLLAEAEAAVQQRLEEVRKAVEQEREEALKSLRQEVIAQAIELTRNLLIQASERSLHQQLALRLLETLRQLPELERQRLQADWLVKESALLETAQGLDNETLGHLKVEVSSIVGRPVELTVQTNHTLIGGLRLRIGGQVWDSSLAGTLRGTDQSSFQEARA